MSNSIEDSQSTQDNPSPTGSLLSATRPSWWFVGVSVIVAWACDALFWMRSPGISFFIWIILIVIGALLLAYKQRAHIAWQTIVLTGLALVFSAVTFLRSEGLTRFLGFLMSLGMLLLGVITFRKGEWPFFRLEQYAAEAARLLFNSLVRPEVFFHRSKNAGQTQKNQALPILRGLLLAIPVLCIMSGLLASADLVFAKRMESILNIFDLNHLAENLFRLGYILVFAYLFTGMYLHAIMPLKTDENYIHPDLRKPLFGPFLGFTEAVIILGLVNVLFVFFVSLQFQYLFGGQSNISTAGFTFSEYAVRGFNELVFVAVISVMLFLTLNRITRIQEPKEKNWLSGLTILLLVLVLVILISAFQRLALYESAYGFTQLRTYTHVFMIWMGVLLASSVGLEILHRGQRFALALLVVSIGFCLTFAILNVDGFIVQQNINRARNGASFDREYISSLSLDVVPALVDAFNDPAQPPEIHAAVTAELACRADALRQEAPPDWVSFNLSADAARRILLAQDAPWGRYKITGSNPTRAVIIDGRLWDCNPRGPID